MDALRPGANSVAGREKDHQKVVRELVENGHDHVMIPGGVRWMATVKDEDVTAFFEGFDLDKVRNLFYVFQTTLNEFFFFSSHLLFVFLKKKDPARPHCHLCYFCETWCCPTCCDVSWFWSETTWVSIGQRECSSTPG